MIDQDLSATEEPPASGIRGFRYADLHSPERLRDLYETWERGLADTDPALHARYVAWRAGARPAPQELSALLVEVAPHVAAFVARLFGVTAEREALRRATADE